jgi:Tol biopolymer transport system component/predicted Ser/Thr protein kinase
MSLSAGHRLGGYEILSPLGAGGMGEVYRARDTRLGRDVAIKVLPADRLTDESRRRRFVQEARAASALNHPNIVTIHEIESADGADFIVMEYVPGKTLDALIRPRMRLSDVLRIAVPIADALARAHAAGIVHRDLKPANVVVTPEGVVKVLDFGLAKLMATEEVSDEQDTLTAEASGRFVSRLGTIAGTPGYMSPEQAAGAKVDARSDIFAFGCLLYEMVTGRRAFPGDSQAETLDAVRNAQPKPPGEIVADVPADLEKLILRCLRKEPEKRFQHVADVRVELEEIREGSISSATARGSGLSPRRRGRIWMAAAFAVAIAAVAGSWFLQHSRRPAPPAPRVLTLTATQGDEGWPTFSPDGNQVAFSWDGETAPEGVTRNYDIWLKLIGASQVRRLTTDPAPDLFPSWSPDGAQIAFLRDRPSAGFATVHVVSPLGGAERKVGDLPAALSQIAWSPDGRWLAVRRARLPGETTAEAGGLHLIPLQEGLPRAITAPEPPGYDVHPAFSPDGRRLAYASCGFSLFPPCDVLVVEVGADLVPKAPARRLARRPGGIVGLAWSRDGGSIVYSTALDSTARGGHDRAQLWRVAVDGGAPPERLELAPQGAISPATTASRDRLAFTHTSYDVDIHRFEAGHPSRPILVSSFSEYAPSFSPDGRRIVFESGRSGEREEIWLADADGSNASQLTHGPGVWQGSPRFSPDGRQVAFDSRGEDGYGDVWVIDTEGGVPRRITDGRFHSVSPSWSRDGRWIYYRDDRADGRDINRVPAAGGQPQRVTHHGGLFARESPDGKSLFYTQRDPTSPLVRLELPDGPARQVVDCVHSRSLADAPDGIYFVGCAPEGAEAQLCRLDPQSERTRLLGTLPASVNWGIAVSPDARTILFVKTVDRGADLMLIENFR